MRTARITGLEVELAPEAVADETLAAEIGIALENVRTWSHGRERFFAPDGTGPADLAAAAARRLLQAASLDPRDLDLIVFATNTPDLTFPGSACLLQAQLDAAPVGCLDVRCQCCGFLVAAELAADLVGLGTYGRVLVAAGEVPSHQNRFDGVDAELACM
ncbi:MAG: 3-oxoacyl-ACP synthase, partial [Candidatus Dadabacteria bacterium]